jgi:hypothetical protein
MPVILKVLIAKQKLTLDLNNCNLFVEDLHHCQCRNVFMHYQMLGATHQLTNWPLPSPEQQKDD